MLGSSVATSSEATSLTTFLSSLVVASLLSESNSFSVAKLLLPSSAVASTQATFSQAFLKLKLKSGNTTAKIADPGSVVTRRRYFILFVFMVDSNQPSL